MGLLRKLRILALALAVVAAGGLYGSTRVGASGSTLNVPSQYGSIQAAINAAHNGDTVRVAAGVYHEQLNIYNKYITIQSSGNSGNTVIAPPVPEPTVTWQNVPFTGGVQARLIGFTITNGYSANSGQAGGLTLANGADVQLNDVTVMNSTSVNGGGGMIIYKSNPVLNAVNIVNNFSNSLGGGAEIVQSSPTIYGSTISGNNAYAGGGMWIDNNSQPSIVNSTFSNNSASGANGGGEGGAIGMRTGVGGVIQDNTFTGNSSYYGGAIDMETQGGAPQIVGNTFSSNFTVTSGTDGGSGYGGAVAVYNGTAGTIAGNNFNNNSADKGGGAIVVAENANISIVNNQIINNTAKNNDGGGIYISSAVASVTDNCILGNVGQIGGGIASLNGGSLSLSHNTIISNSAIRNDLSWITGGIYVQTASTSFSSNTDIIANNSGPQLYDEGRSGHTVGTYVGDDWYSAAGNNILAAEGTGPVNQPQNLAQVTNPPFQENSLVSFQPQFTNSTSCDTTDAQTKSYGVPPAPTDVAEPIYRFFGTMNQTHFFTSSIGERNGVLSVQPVSWYHYEGIAFYAYATQVASTIPVYRFFQLSPTGSHFYTASQAEKDYLVANQSTQWQYEGVAFYAYPGGTGGKTDVYRFVNLQNSSHFYTASAGEKQYVIDHLGYEWSYEGVVFSVPDGIPTVGQ